MLWVFSDNVVWNARRMIDIECTKAMNSGGPVPARCYNHPKVGSPFFSLSKVAARALLAGGLYH